MLRKLAYLNYLQFYLGSALGMIPMEVDVKRNQIKRAGPRSGKMKMWKLFCLWIFLRWIRVTYNCLHAMFDHKYFVLKDFPFHIIMAGGFSLCLIWWHSVYYGTPRITVALFNGLFYEDGASSSPKSMYKALRSLTIQEMVALSFPITTLLCASACTAMHILDPLATFFPYGSINHKYHSPWLLSIFITIESFMVILLMTGVSLPIFITVVFFQNCNKELKATIAKLNSMDRFGFRSPKAFLTVYKQCRKLQLMVQLYNKGFARNMFAMKVFCLTGTITQVSFGILLLHKFPFHGIVNMALGVNYTLMYCFGFQKAFVIPMAIKKLKGRVVKQSKTLLGSKAALLCKSINSIPNVGVKVGIFHSFGKGSTLGYLNFTVKNVVRMLVGFRPK